MFYYGKDYFKIGDRISVEDEFCFAKENMTYLNWGNILIAGKWHYGISEKLSVEVAPSFTHYASSLRKDVFESDNKKNDPDYKEQNTKKTTENGIDDLNGNIHFDYFPTERLSINFGMNYIHHRFVPELNRIQTIDLEGLRQYESESKPLTANEIAFYFEDDWKISRIFRLKTGLRMSLFGVEGKTYRTLEPRISLRTSLTDHLSFKSSYSRMSQFAQQISDSYISLPTDFWIPVNSNNKPVESDLVSAGFYYDHSGDYVFSIEGYFKNMRNLLDYREDYSFLPFSTGWDQKLTSGQGWAYGAEFMAIKSNGKLKGSLGYGLMWSDRQFAELNHGKRFPSKYDNRHKINVVVNYKINSIFELNGSWTYITGNRMTLMLEDYLIFSANGFDPSLAPTDPFQNEWVNYYEERNNIRLPAYHRLDFGMNIYRPYKKGRTGIWGIGIWNVYNRMNPIMIRTNTMYSDSEKRKVSPHFQTVGLFPLIPSITYTYKF